MIIIKKSTTADTRSCDYTKVTLPQLKASSEQHIKDVGEALLYFNAMIHVAAQRHDADKISDIGSFHADFITGFKQTGWWDRHRKLNRHHLSAADGVPDDVNLIDVLEMVADCVTAGMGRTGEVYPIELPNDVLQKALDNTARLLIKNIRVEES